MQIHITGKHIDSGDALREHIEAKIEGLTQYFNNVVDVNVVLKTEGHRHLAEVNTLLSGIVLRAHGEGGDFYIAVDEVIDKLVRQLQKYKGRLQKHRKRRQEESVRFGDIQPIQATEHEMEEDALENAPDDIFAEYIPAVVHKEIRDLPSLSVDEAVMQMDLMHMNFFIFQNAKTSDINVVFRRDDGKVSWIETNAKKGKKSAA